MEENIKSFLDYLHSADIVYINDVLYKNLEIKGDISFINKETVISVSINPNKTFTVTDLHKHTRIFELYMMKPHFPMEFCKC